MFVGLFYRQEKLFANGDGISKAFISSNSDIALAKNAFVLPGTAIGNGIA